MSLNDKFDSFGRITLFILILLVVLTVIVVPLLIIKILILVLSFICDTILAIQNL